MKKIAGQTGITRAFSTETKLPNGMSLIAERGVCRRRRRTKGPRMVQTHTGPAIGHDFRRVTIVGKQAKYTRSFWRCTKCQVKILKCDHMYVAMDRQCHSSVQGNGPSAKKRRLAITRGAVSHSAQDSGVVVVPRRRSCRNQGARKRVAQGFSQEYPDDERSVRRRLAQADDDLRRALPPDR